MRWVIGAVICGALCAHAAGEIDEEERQLATEKAQEAYERALSQGTEMSRGPCLGMIMEDWVVDVAHQPRQPVDDDPENQCAAFRSGRAEHFVELDPTGKVIRVR